MNRVIYFRPGGIQDAEEHLAAAECFPVVTSRMQIPPGSLVIPRYSALPYYRELEKDVINVGGRLINSFEEHRFIADLRQWYELLKDYTFETWFQGEFTAVPDVPVVLKGLTNSRKQQWDRLMFAQDRKRAWDIMERLLDDPMMQEQGLCVRRYVPLKKLGEGLNGMPVTNEWRFFVLCGKVVAHGFYWASHPECAENARDWADVHHLVQVVIDKVSSQVPFFVVDVAQDEVGRWWVVELNDGQMSGLSMIDPKEFYSRLCEELDAVKHPEILWKVHG